MTSGSSVVAAPSSTTTYTVIIRQNQCYADTARVSVVVIPIPTINAGPDQTIASGSSANLFATSQDATKWIWTPAQDLSCTDCLTPVASPKRTTTYTIEASNEWGCRASDDVTVHVTCDLAQIFIPNTFTPNGDGQNDRFYPRGKGIGTVKRFRIYNRWGEVVYDMQNMPVNDMNLGWDGSHRGAPMKPDVYVWIVDAQCENGESLQLKGDISLLR
jgi:gliding motility-associated-like protein